MSRHGVGGGRILLLSLCLLIPVAMPQRISSPSLAAAEEASRMISHEKAWGQFVRTYFGCPLDPRIMADEKVCHPAQGHWDQRLYKKAQSTAASMFALRE